MIQGAEGNLRALFICPITLKVPKPFPGNPPAKPRWCGKARVNGWNKGASKA